MPLVKFTGSQVDKYPYAVDELYVDYPGIYFPDLTDKTLEPFNVANVIVTGAPDHDVNTQVAEQIGCEYSVERDRWETAWIVRPMTNEEIAARIEQIKVSVVAATQQRLDAFAQTRAYDGILSACTYAASAVPKFASEGQCCVDARDATWEALYTLMAEVESGQRPMPSGYADIEPLLPSLAWPA